ncbi:MAG: hypothetical protein KAR42_17610 [candidate division Zixibacteria bacterium]|nr:hypothetical protein [candidate division Zixibacteria bacterium]
MDPNETKTDEPVVTPAPAETTPPPPTPGQGEGDDGQSFDKAEYTRKTQELAALKRRAIDAGYDDPQDYMNDLEVQAAGLKQPPVKETPPEKPAVSGDEASLRQEIDALKQNQSMINKQNTIVMMNTMYSDYNRQQGALDAEQKFGFTKKELNDFMLDRRNAGIIGDVAREEEANGDAANWYRIAADMMSFKKSRASLKKEGAKQQEALSDAEKSATALSNTAPPPSEGAEKTPNQKKAERIAPDTRKQF